MTRERLFALLVLGLGLGAVIVLWRVAPPVVLGFALAAALESPIEWVQRRTGIRRAGATTLVLLVLALGTLVVGFWSGAQLIHELLVVHAHAPKLAHMARRSAEELLRRVGGMSASRLFGLAQDQRSTLAHVASQVVMRLLHALARVPRLFGTVALSVVVAYVALLEGPLGRAFEGLRRSHLGGLVRQTLATAGQAAWRLASAELLLASYTAASSVLLFAVLGASVPVLLGVLAGLCDMVPYAGPAVLYVPWAIILLSTGHTLHGVEVLVGWALLVASRAVFELRWVGKGIGLSPLWVLVSFYLGGRLGGLPGILLGPVVAAAVWGVFASPGRPPQGPAGEQRAGPGRKGDAQWVSEDSRSRAKGTFGRAGGMASSWAGVGRLQWRRLVPRVWRFSGRRGRWGDRPWTW